MDAQRHLDGQIPGSPNSNGETLQHRRVIVAGYGPVGRTVVQRLEQAGMDVTIIETNPQTIERQRALDKQVIEGDATDPAVLQTAGIDSAEALILAMPDELAAVRACQVARQLNPHIFIAARTNFLSQGLLATRAGADEVIVEEVVTAEAMQQAVVQRLLHSARTDGQNASASE